MRHPPSFKGGSPPCNASAPTENYSTHKIIRQFIFPHPAKSNKPVNPFTGWHLQGKRGGLQSGFPAARTPIMGKGVFQCTSIETSLGYNKYFPFIVFMVKEENCLLIWAFMAIMQKIP